ncbi:MAG TPA: phosphatase PAP2 family protein [Terriglobales bacterium]|nr:phosphatase PAP2 family protein [Terriglobales bacterium]
MRWCDRLCIFFFLLLCMSAAPAAWGQTPEPSGCGGIIGRLPGDAASFGHGMLMAPRNAIRPANLKWELPIIAATGVLIGTGIDTHVANHIHSASLVNNSARASNIGLGLELGGAGLMYVAGCHGQRSPYLANTGWTALEAMGAANVLGEGIKALLNREYPYTGSTEGEFWEGGKSFPSGHAATSFAFASVVAHRYPRNWWLKVGVYGLATGVSLARVTGKKHFPSDVLVGGTLGYITGTYLVDHSGENSH